MRRLAELQPGRAGSIFTSDLSVNEFLLVRPGCSSARRRMASCGTPAVSSSVAMFPCSVMLSPVAV